jgi:hypothetical protein
MATTTPNYGWAVPTSTDLVKDGATAIETLGDAIDASLVDLRGGTTGQVLKKASATQMDFEWGSAGGLTLISTTSFSAVASQAIPTVFSATYDYYKIILNLVGSSAGNMYLRMRNGVTDETANSYYSQLVSGSNTTISGARSQLTYFQIGQLNNSAYAGFEITMYNPFAARNTVMTSQNTEISGGASGVRFYNFTNALATTTSYDSLLLYPDSLNITGTCSVYGLAK